MFVCIVAMPLPKRIAIPIFDTEFSKILRYCFDTEKSFADTGDTDILSPY